MPAIDYGNDYATILPDGRLVPDLSSTRITGPMVPVVRVARAWIDGPLRGAIEGTYDKTALAALGARMKVIGEKVDHVLRVEPDVKLVGKVLQATGGITVGGSGVYPFNVTIDKLAGAIVSVGAR